MKKLVAVTIFCLGTSMCLMAQTDSEGPVAKAVDKTEHLAHKAARKIDEHVVEPTKRHVVEPTKRHVVRPARRAINNDQPKAHPTATP